MKKNLEAIKDRLAKLLERSEGLSSAENEDVASKYEEVATCIADAIDAISTAVDLLS